MERNPLTLRCSNGSMIEICDEDNKDYPCFISWSLGTSSMFGTYENGVELRSFLRKALRRLEADQRRLSAREAKKALSKHFNSEQINRFKELRRA